MNTLSSNKIQELLHDWTVLKECVNKITANKNISSFKVHGLQGSMQSLFVKEYCIASRNRWLSSFKYTSTGYRSQSFLSSEKSNQKLLIIVPTEREALELYGDFKTFFEEAQINLFQDWGTAYYRPVSRGAVIFGKRAGVLSKMALQKKDLSKITEFQPEIFIAAQKTMQTPLPPPEYILKMCFSIKKNAEIDTVKLAEKLTISGYTRVPKVTVRGEFSLRGEVLDIFLPTEENPARILFDFNIVENIKNFEIETQTTTNTIDCLTVYPMKEVFWNKELIDKLEELLSEKEKSSDTESCVPCLELTPEAKKWKNKFLEEIKNTGCAEGEELFYPALWNKEFSILDYFKDCPVFLFDYDRLVNSNLNIDREMNGMYRTARQNMSILSPEKISLKFENLEKRISNCIKYCTLSTENDTSLDNFILNCEPPQSYFGNINYIKEEFERLQKDDWNIFIFADNDNQALRLKEILKNFINPQNKNLNAIKIIGKSVSTGFSIPEIKLKVIQENEIFGRRKFIPKSLHRVKSQPIDTFVELNPGDYVVHVNYGIGLFKGIDRVKAMGNERDYIKLEYADEETIFVPIEQVNLVQRYIGSEENPKLDKLGGKSWEARKNKVRQSVEDLAQKLIVLYSKRQASKGYPFPKDTEWQTMFEAAFPYEDTPDQITVTEEIKKDMESTLPMDRLICGDVGYGKTEIAMRAAFKAVMGGKQVAFLAPTTILAEQHYETCIERFQQFPVKIARLSRFTPSKEVKKILEQITVGEIDILIGTHRIIQKDVLFKNLGLMIIDEEQRFGVKDKEKLKLMRENIDCLAMSATPIPRTLHMSLLKIRDMSLLTTPPQNRQPIETVIDPYSEEKVVQAIRLEIERGGQVFYLHNRVETLDETRIKLQHLMPELSVDSAHGQMTSDELDDIFRRFKLGGFHILVSTTIIENGIDIPNVNTIIIDRADMYGISQLYQLRGRVGRSDRKAYAYLLYPKNRALSEIAMKRLQVISDFTELGSGFKIAMKDMEIRGAGNLLGRDQSGSVYAVGFDLYVKLLNEAVNRLVMEEDFKTHAEVLIELDYTGFIPDTYVQNPQTKMEIYKKIAAIQTQDEMDGLYIELTDRFGPMPEEILSLLAISEIKIICNKLNVSSLKEKKGFVYVEFLKVSDISVDKVLKLVTKSAGNVKLDSSKPNQILLRTGQISLKEKSEYLREKLASLL